MMRPPTPLGKRQLVVLKMPHLFRPLVPFLPVRVLWFLLLLSFAHRRAPQAQQPLLLVGSSSTPPAGSCSIRGDGLTPTTPREASAVRSRPLLLQQRIIMLWGSTCLTISASSNSTLFTTPFSSQRWTAMTITITIPRQRRQQHQPQQQRTAVIPTHRSIKRRSTITHEAPAASLILSRRCGSPPRCGGLT